MGALVPEAGGRPIAPSPLDTLVDDELGIDFVTKGADQKRESIALCETLAGW
jgi:hypothetical protein